MNRRILVVDNDIAFTDMLKEVLTNYGYHVNICNSFREILACLKKEPVSLIILDIILHEFDGRDFIKLVEDDKKKAQIPIIFITSRESNDVAISNKYPLISKPFTMHTLITEIDRVLM